MSKINTQNIEEWMFDYHEGSLSEEDKSELLNFLHIHPEYNADLGLWAQTHALNKEEIAIPVDLLVGVLKPIAPFYFQYKFGMGTITGVGLTSIAIGFYLFFRTPKNQETTPLTSVKQLEIKSIEGSKTMNQQPTTSCDAKEKVFETKSSKAPQRLIMAPVHISPILKDSITATGETSMKEEEIPSISPEVETGKSDTLSVNHIVLPVEVKSKETALPEANKKKRKPLPFNLKPQQKFKPANPNF